MTTYRKTMREALEEMHDSLNEGTWATPDTPKEKAALKKLLSKPLKAKDASDKLYDLVGDDEMADDLDDYADKHPNEDVRAMVKSHMKRLGIKEEADLDEATKWKMGDGRPRGGSNIENVRFWDLSKDELQYIMKDADAAMEANPTGRKFGKYADEVNDANTVLGWRKKNGIKEDVDLDEASKEGTIKIIKTKDGKFQIQKMTKGKFVDIGKPYNSAKEAEKFRSGHPDLFGEDANLDEARQLKDPKKEVMVVKKGEVIVIDKKDQDNYMKKGWKLAEGFDEASARSDAMKAMRKGKSVDPADVDNTATDDDVKAASKNILMQLRKAVNLRGTFAVEFGDKKKVKVSAKIAQAAATKYNSLKRPAEKEKFQAQIGKSYADLLKSIKESTVKESKFGIINKQLKGEK